jgi:hypothetical protein
MTTFCFRHWHRTDAGAPPDEQSLTVLTTRETITVRGKKRVSTAGHIIFIGPDEASTHARAVAWIEGEKERARKVAGAKIARAAGKAVANGKRLSQHTGEAT